MLESGEKAMEWEGKGTRRAFFLVLRNIENDDGSRRGRNAIRRGHVIPRRSRAEDFPSRGPVSITLLPHLLYTK